MQSDGCNICCSFKEFQGVFWASPLMGHGLPGCCGAAGHKQRLSRCLTEKPSDGLSLECACVCSVGPCWSSTLTDMLRTVSTENHDFPLLWGSMDLARA